jgi:hypothetical protein
MILELFSRAKQIVKKHKCQIGVFSCDVSVLNQLSSLSSTILNNGAVQHISHKKWYETYAMMNKY